VSAGSSTPLRASLDAALAGGGGPTICLLVPVSRREAFTPRPRRALFWLRNRARRRLDLLRWRLGLAVAWHHSTYEDHAHTNRGDIAIARASVALLQGACGPGARIVDIGWAELRAASGWIAAHADLFVLGGGGFYYLHTQGRLAERAARDVALMCALPCPLASLGPGVNRLLGDGDDAEALHPDSAAVLGLLLARLAVSTVRDRHSRDILERVAPGRTSVAADPALFLTPADPTPARSDDGVLTIGLNLAFHGPNRSRALAEQVRLLASAARALARRRACRFRYFVHCEAERVIPTLLRMAGVPVQTVDAPAEAMLGCYAQLDLHVCQMLHSSILAANAGVPFVVLGYDVKNAAFCEMLGLARYCLPADSTTDAQLLAAIDAALAERAALASGIAERKRALRADMECCLADIARLVTHAG
jgi:polysaccharide pyruvyl transferase WcaK-like protein